MEIPPMRVAFERFELRWPATAISTIPTNGTVMLARMLGPASLNISLFIGLIFRIMLLLPEFAVVLQHSEVRIIALYTDAAIFEGLFYRTARFVGMCAWGKAAFPGSL